RAPGADVAMADPRGLHGQREGEREFLTVVALQTANRKGKGPLERVQEGPAAAGVQAPVQPQDAESGAIVQGGVLERPAPGNLHTLDVDLDGFPRLGLFEELQLTRRALRGPPQVREAQVTKRPLDRAHGQRNSMRPEQPQAGPHRAVPHGYPGLPNMAPARPDACSRLGGADTAVRDR